MTKRSRVWKRVFSVRITWALEEPANFLCRFSITTLSSNPNIFPLVESSPHLSVNIGFTWTQVYLSHLKQCCVQLSSDATTHRRCLWHILARYANWGEASLTNICSQIQQTHTHTHTSGKQGNSWHCPGNPCFDALVAGGRKPWELLLPQTFAANKRSWQTGSFLALPTLSGNQCDAPLASGMH